MPASLFVCRSTALRPRALRPQLERDPLGSAHVTPRRTARVYIRSRHLAGYLMARLTSLLVSVSLLSVACHDFAAPAPDPVANVVPPPCADPAPLLGTTDPRVPGYIVVFDDSVDGSQETARLAVEYGFEPTHVYQFALQGFSAELPPSVVAKVRCEPTVNLVEHDQLFTLDG